MKVAVTRGCIPVIIQDAIKAEWEEVLPLKVGGCGLGSGTGCGQMWNQGCWTGFGTGCQQVWDEDGMRADVGW